MINDAIETEKSSRIQVAWYLLYFTYAIFPIIIGIDKFFDYLAYWDIYLNHAIPTYLHMSPTAFMYVSGITEVLLGLLVFIKPRIGGYIITFWLLAIIINLISMGTHSHPGFSHVMTHYDIALRDAVMVMGSAVFILLSYELDK